MAGNATYEVAGSVISDATSAAAGVYLTVTSIIVVTSAGGAAVTPAGAGATYVTLFMGRVYTVATSEAASAVNVAESMASSTTGALPLQRLGAGYVNPPHDSMQSTPMMAVLLITLGGIRVLLVILLVGGIYAGARLVF
ncbi:hypothetical protein FRB94_001441 [Tulasnella sp. JGI-2019a]|nr:hypothetical protein FRB94_001441 [Tulasnella sp. JGI-2019a]